MTISLIAATASVESDTRPGLHAHLNGVAAQVGTDDLNSAFRTDKHGCSFHAFSFRSSSEQGEQ